MDLLLRGARVVDGSGAPPQPVDVRVARGRIAEIGRDLAATGADVVSLDGLCLAPGFIDLHTHYDAQVLWDSALTPSSWHGVTTVVMGNCGFSIAPVRPEHRDAIVETLRGVEGMSGEALRSGIRWEFESFGEYLDFVERLPKQIHVGGFVGHTAVRLYVMGEAAYERAATADEIAAMRGEVARALAAGALGFATSKAPSHTGAGGRPVPSRLADEAEIFALGDALREAGHGLIEATVGPGLFLAEFARLAQATGRPVTWAALATGVDYAGLIGGAVTSARPERGAALAIVEETCARGANVWPQVPCRPLVVQVNMADPFLLYALPAFARVSAAPRAGRAAIYADAAWRERARPEVDRMWQNWWTRARVQETKRHAELLGLTLAEIAQRRGVAPCDVLFDLAVEDEDLATRIEVRVANDDEQELGDLLRDRRTVLGLSDAGAHADMLCDASFATYLLQRWVRELGAIPLELAIWRLSGHPAQLLGLRDRGLIRAGYVADLVAFDPERVGTLAIERVFDFPAGADRLIARSTGIEHIWVAGTAIRRAGEVVEDAFPGTVIRGAGTARLEA